MSQPIENQEWYGPRSAAGPRPPVPETEEIGPLRQAFLQHRAALLACAGLTGAACALCFCRAPGWGINVTVFSAVWVWCLLAAYRRLGVFQARRDVPLGMGILLLGLSVAWTANAFVQLVSRLGIFLLSAMMLLEPFCATRHWSLWTYIGAGFRLLAAAVARLPEPFVSLMRRPAGRRRLPGHPAGDPVCPSPVLARRRPAGLRRPPVPKAGCQPAPHLPRPAGGSGHPSAGFGLVFPGFLGPVLLPVGPKRPARPLRCAAAPEGAGTHRPGLYRGPDFDLSGLLRDPGALFVLPGRQAPGGVYLRGIRPAGFLPAPVRQRYEPAAGTAVPPPVPSRARPANRPDRAVRLYLYHGRLLRVPDDPVRAGLRPDLPSDTGAVVFAGSGRAADGYAGVRIPPGGSPAPVFPVGLSVPMAGVCLCQAGPDRRAVQPGTFRAPGRCGRLPAL